MAEKRVQGNNRLDLPSKGRAYFDDPFGMNASNLPVVGKGDNEFNLTLNQQGITTLAPNVIVKPAPPTKSVQFNEDDEFGGTPDFVYDYYVENVGIGTYDPTTKTQIFNELGFNDDGTIYTIVPSGSNHIYVGGNFERYIGKEYNNIIKLDLSGSVDTSFNIGTGFNGPVRTIVLKDNQLYVGGEFTSYSGSNNINYIARLNSDGTLDTTFNTNGGFDGPVYTILNSTISNDDAIFVGGNFTKYGINKGSNATFLNKIIKITGSGDVDTTFNPNGGFDANFSSSIYSIVHDANDNSYIFVGGKFTSYSGSNEYQYGNSGIVRISANGPIDISFNQSSSAAGGTSGSAVYSIFHPNPSDLYIGGDFTKYSGSVVSKITKLDPSTGQLESTWNGSSITLSGGGVRTIHYVSSETYLLIGGLFSLSAGDGTVQKLALLNPSNGTLVSNNIAGRTLIGGGDVYASVKLNETASIVGGDFTQYRPNFTLGTTSPIRLVNCDKIIIVETPSLYPQTSSYFSFFDFDYRNRDSFFISTSLGVFKTISSSHNTSLIVKNSGYVGFNTGSPQAAMHLFYGEGPLLKVDSAYSSSILYVTSSGIVGVMTGNPNGDENVRLHVSGAIRATHLSESFQQYFISYNTSSGLFTYSDTASFAISASWAPPTPFDINVEPDTAIQFASGSAGDEVLSGSLDFVYDYTNKRVGLGLSNPLVKLHISGASNDTIFRISSPITSSLVNVFGSGVTTIKYNDTNFEGLILENINSGSNTALTTLVLRDSSSIHRGGIDFAGGIYRNEGLRDSIILKTISGSTPTTLHIIADVNAQNESQTHNSNIRFSLGNKGSVGGKFGTPLVRMLITSSLVGGVSETRVGIGNFWDTASGGSNVYYPKNTLEVRGGLTVYTITASNLPNIPQINVIGYNTATGHLTYLSTSSLTSNVNVEPNKAIQFASGSAGDEVLSGSLDFVYDYNATTNAGETGAVGIGTSTPSAKLDVYGTFQQGVGTEASGSYSHAEGEATRTYGSASHAEGYGTLASGSYSHAEGESAEAVAYASHAEGYYTKAFGSASHAEGYYTIANGNYQLTIGQYNIPSSISSSFIIGNGLDDLNRKNLVETSGSHFRITGSLYLTESRNISQQHLLMYDTASGEVTYFTASSAGGSSTPAPPSKSIQYNNAGAFGGNSNFIYDYDTSKMGIFTSTPEALLHINTQQNNPSISKLFKIDSPESDVYGNLLSNIIYVTSSGQVGINTDTPNAKLHIFGNGSFDDPPQYLLLVDDYQNDPYNLVARFGRIGIGYNEPQFKLHISGGISAILPYESQTNVVMYDTNNGEFTYYDASAFGGGTPGGNDQSVQYNNAGAFGGSGNFTWDDANLKLTITGSLYLSQSRNIPQQHLLMYDTASGEVTYFNRTAAIITTDGNITIDVAKTSSVFWSASFSADRVMSCSFSNAAVGTSLRVMVQNGGSLNGAKISFATETSTPNTYNYSGNNFSNAAGLFFKSGSNIGNSTNQNSSNIEIIKVSDGTYIGTILASNPI